jgi:hypothetical protein
MTIRRRVRVAGVRYIGKEANRWEEQLYLGVDSEAQIEHENLTAHDGMMELRASRSCHNIRTAPTRETGRDIAGNGCWDDIGPMGLTDEPSDPLAS